MSTDNPDPVPEVTPNRHAGPNDTRFNFLLHQYDSVRAEHLASRSAQQTVMTAAMASTAAVFAALLSTWSNVDVRIGILSFAPLFLTFVWFIWFGEVLRIGRTSWFLWELEQLVNAELRTNRPPVDGTDLDPTLTLHWEGWLRGQNPWGKPLRGPLSYVLASATVLGTALVSTIMSFVFAFSSQQVAIGLKILTSVSGIAWAVMFAYVIASIRHPIIRSVTKSVPGSPSV
jgi:hypothetical protein